MHSYSYGRSYEGIRKYSRKLGSLQRAESVADRGAEEKTELGLIYGYKFSSGRGSGNTIQAQFSSSLTLLSPLPALPFALSLFARPLPLVTTRRSRGTLDAELRCMNTFVQHPSRARMKHGMDVTEVR